MKKLLFDVGGKPWANDDLETLQQELAAAATATIVGAPAMVLSGCSVSVTGPNVGDIAPGYVWMSGEVQYFAGAAAVALPAEMVATGRVESDPRAYQTGGTKNCMSELELSIVGGGTSAPGTELIFFVAGPVQTYAKWLESQTRTVGEVQWLSRHEAGLYDATGKGWGDLAGAGWQLCNGNGGAADLRERFIVGFNPAAGDYDTPRKTGGAARVTLTPDEMPEHSHTMQSAGAHYHTVGLASNSNDGSQAQKGNGQVRTGNTSTAGEHTHSLDTAGGGLSHENRPPFYVLIAREWVGL